jgi:sugar phosphate isomerase/epimerase
MVHIGINTDNWRHEDKPLELRKKIDKHHLKVSQLDVSFPINRWECIDFIRRGIIYAGLLGVPCVDTTDGKYKVPGMSDKEQIDRIIYHLSQCISVAENHKVIINVEPHGPFTTNPEYLLQIVEHFQSPWVKINFDTGNSFIAGHDPAKYLKTLRRYVTHLHIKDVSPELAASVRGEETGIGSSIVPVGGGVNAENIKKCLEYLHKTKWSGAVSIECHGSDENTKASVDWLRGVLKSLKKK